MLIRRRCFLFSLTWLVLPTVFAQQENPLDTVNVARLLAANTNEFRQREGQRQVVGNAQLSEAALDFARFLSRSDKFGHDADGRRPEERARQHGYDYCIVSENLAYRYNSKGFSADELARNFVQGWERSPGHRQNMLNPEVTEIGVAVAHNEQSGYYYAVQMFGRPQSDAIAFKITNNTIVTISYALSGEPLSLPPGFTRAHRQCGSIGLTVQWPDNQGPTTVTPRNGDRYTIDRESSGKYRLNKK